MRYSIHDMLAPPCVNAQIGLLNALCDWAVIKYASEDEAGMREASSLEGRVAFRCEASRNPASYL